MPPSAQAPPRPGPRPRDTTAAARPRPRLARPLTAITAAAVLLAGLTTTAAAAPSTSSPTTSSPSTSAPTSPSAAQAPATATFADDFERTAGDVGNGWTEARGDWRIDDGEVRNAVTGAQNNLLVQDGLDLGTSWSVSADVRVAPYNPATGREWSGVAGNVHVTEDGQLSYYLLRVATAASTGSPSTGRWHLLKMTASSTVEVLDQGTFTGPSSLPGHAGVVATLSRDGDRLTGTVTDPDGATLVDATATLAPDPTFVGGRTGLYAVTDNLRADAFEATTSTPAVQPPGPLVCDTQTGDYTFPQGSDEVLETSDLGMTWAGMFVVQDLLTRGDDQYVGFYDADRNMVVAHRTLPDGEWTYQVLDEQIAWDSHNYISLGLDREGALHVSGNMHNVRLAYFRSAPGGDVTTLQRVASMVDPATEGSVTYPEFVNRKDGSLVFSHRNGGSGSGVTYFNVYDESTDAWTRLVDQPFFDGLGSDADPAGTWNSYFQGPTLGPDGLFHLLWVWRDTPDAATNSMLTYAKSEDLVNWVDAAGNPLETPFRYGEGDVVDPVPDRAGLLNGNAKIGFTAAGEVMVSYHKYDDAGRSQLYAATPAGEDWTISQITDWEGRWSFGGGGTLIFEVQVLGSSVLADGNVQVDFLCSGSPQSIVVDPDLEPLAQAPTPALPGDLSEIRTPWDGEEGLQVNVRADRGDVPAPATDRGRYVLRWESLPENRDLPREQWPTGGSQLQVVLLGEPEDTDPPVDPPAPAPGSIGTGSQLTVAPPYRYGRTGGAKSFVAFYAGHDGARVQGTVFVTTRKVGSSQLTATAWSYSGTTTRMWTPTLPTSGSWQVTATFVPSDPAYRPSVRSWWLWVTPSGTA